VRANKKENEFFPKKLSRASYFAETPARGGQISTVGGSSKSEEVADLPDNFVNSCRIT
jgi:hypothetical protein